MNGLRDWVRYLDGHASNVKAVREEDALAEHALVARCELNLGDGEGVAEVQGAIHVRVGEVSEPFGEVFLDVGGGDVLCLFRGWGVNLEEAFCGPTSLVF